MEREGSGQTNFIPLPISNCTDQGGQCKHQKVSGYIRGPKGRPAARVKAVDNLPEQVHLIGGYPDEMTVVFVTAQPHSSAVELRPASGLQNIQVYNGTTNVYSAKHMLGAGNVVGDSWSTVFNDDIMPDPNAAKLRQCTDAGWAGYKDPGCVYSSGFVHTVIIGGLTPETMYEYRPVGSSRWRPIKTNPAIGQPISFGVLADLGMTTDSLATMRHMANKLNDGSINGAIFIGDLSYADGYGNGWDDFARLGEFLFERMPTTYTPGNHEFANEQYAHYITRYPSPPQRIHNSFTPLYYSYKAGLAHVIMLCSYCESTVGSLQYNWLKEELTRVDRSETPWLLVTAHVPWYTSNAHHSMAEGNSMRLSMEPLLYESKADFFLVGHLHAYERMTGIYQNQTTCDGPVHLTIGDAGNHEGPACPWWEQTMPAWEEIREYSFGHAVLRLHNDSHAEWSWHRNQDQEDVMADQVWIKRADLRCAPSADLVV